MLTPKKRRCQSLAPPCSISSHTKGKHSNAAAIDALVVFEADTDTGKVNTVEHVLRVPEKSPPNVDAFFIPHGITSDLDFQELNTATRRRSSRANSSGSLRDGNGRDSTTGAEEAKSQMIAMIFFRVRLPTGDVFTAWRLRVRPGLLLLFSSEPKGETHQNWKICTCWDCIVFTGHDARFACGALGFALQCMHREDEDKDVVGGEKRLIRRLWAAFEAAAAISTPYCYSIWHGTTMKKLSTNDK